MPFYAKLVRVFLLFISTGRSWDKNFLWRSVRHCAEKNWEYFIVKPYIFTYMLSFASISQPTILCINFNCNLFVTTFPPSSPKVSPWLFDLMTLTPGKCIRLKPDPERYRRRMTTVGRCGWLRLHSNDSLQILSHNTTCDPSKYWKNVVIFPLKTNFEHSTLWSGIHKK